MSVKFLVLVYLAVVTFEYLAVAEQTKSLLGTLHGGNEVCYETWDKGLSYRGKMSTTETGKTCQKWPKSTRNRVRYTGESNFCRNPRGHAYRPWCRTTTSTRWEYCDVPNCSELEVKPGWLLIQKRETPGLDFNKNWNDYKKGFAYSSKDFWLGLEMIHQLTKNGSYGLRLEFETHRNLKRFAEWKNFKIGNETEKYKMHISGFDKSSSSFVDYMSWTNGQEFVTWDRDNSISCAGKVLGGWWMRPKLGANCVRVHFNNHLRSRLGSSLYCVHYFRFRGYTTGRECLKKVRMILIKH